MENKEIAQMAREIFARNFDIYLNRAGKTQADIADELGVSSATVSDWANGKKYPRVDKMQRIADYLGVLISDLREDKPVKDIAVSRIERARKKMPQEKKDAMMKVLEGAFYEYFSDNFVDEDTDE